VGGPEGLTVVFHVFHSMHGMNMSCRRGLALGSGSDIAGR
jgi:hypothetical protein